MLILALLSILVALGAAYSAWVAPALAAWQRHRKNQLCLSLPSCPCWFPILGGQKLRLKWASRSLLGPCDKAVPKTCRHCCSEGLAVTGLENDTCSDTLLPQKGAEYPAVEAES